MDIERLQELAGVPINEDIAKSNKALQKLDRVLMNVFNSLDYRLLDDEKAAIIEQHVNSFLNQYKDQSGE